MRLAVQKHWIIDLRNKGDDQEPLEPGPNKESSEPLLPEIISFTRGLVNALYDLSICKLINKSTQNRPKNWVTETY